jgi:hypothetical protein
MRPTIASLRAAVERAIARGPLGLDIGKMSHAERDEYLFRIVAQGTEAGTAETPQSGSVHDGPVAESDAPTPHQDSSREEHRD